MERHHRKAIFTLSVLTAFVACTHSGEFLSCLTYHGVHNFTTLFSSPSTYNHFFHHSLHNLAFARSSFLRPSSIVLPGSKHQLATTIKCARNASLMVRIRSGGHSTEGLSSTADTPFVIVDLMNLNRVLIDVDSQTAWVESGATAGELYFAIGQSSDSFAVVAGWSSTVGIGGYISGGGTGILTRKFGLAADNVVDAILIDANGQMLDREAMGEDVFWAIRGGGGGVFGAIYAWKIQMVPVPKPVTTFSVFKTFQPSNAAKLLHKFQHVAPELVDDFSVTIVAGAMPDDLIWVQLRGLFLGPKSETVSLGSLVFSELGVPVEECKEMRWIEAVSYLLGLGNVDDLRKRTQPNKPAFSLKSDFVRTKVPVEGFVGIAERLQKEPHALIVLLGLGGAMARIRNDAIPFPHRDGNLFAIEYIVNWSMEEDSESDIFVESLHELYEYMTPFVSNNPRAAYVNHMDFDFGRMDWLNAGDAVEIARSWGERYFLGNYDRLVLAKTIIDPDNVFRHPQSIPPLPSMCDGIVSGARDSTSASTLLDSVWF